MKFSKKLLSLLLCAIMVLGSVAVGGEGFAEVLDAFSIKASAASSGTCGDYVYWNLSDDGVLTISGTGNMTNYSYSDAPWYSSRLSIKTVIIESGVTSIGSYAFSSCTGLTSVTIPDSVTSIGSFAFSSCTGLTSVTIPDSVTSIGSYAFNYVNNISYSENMTAAGSPWGAKHVNVYVEGYLIYSDSSKTELCGCSSAAAGSITIPDSVTSIGSDAFYNCKGLTSITIPNSVTSIGYDAFYGCTGLKSAGPIGSGCDYEYGWTDIIPSYAFSGCTGLTSVTIGNNVKKIGSSAFWYCESLKSIDLKNVLVIDDDAFYGCSSLKEIYICGELQYIGPKAFESTSLTDVYYGGNHDSRMKIDIYISYSSNYNYNNETIRSAIWHYNYTGNKKLLTSIAVTSNPVQTSYNVGDSLNTSGLKLNAVYSDTSSENITSGFTCVPSILLTPGTQQITVTFEGKTATFNVTVNAAVDKTLEEIRADAISELNELKKNAVSDEAKKIIDDAIAAINISSNVNDIASKIVNAENAVNSADKALSDAKSKAITELVSAEFGSEEARSIISAAVRNINSAASLDKVEAIKQKAFSDAKEADRAAGIISIKTAGAKEFDYRSIVTIKATAENVPEGYKLAIYLGIQRVAEGDSKSVTYTYGELKSDLNYSVKVIDADGNIQKDSSGKELSKDGGKITCKAGFFQKLIAFFRGLFGSLPKVEVKP